MTKQYSRLFFGMLVVLVAGWTSVAQAQPSASPAGSKYGPFNLFDRRSQYGKGAFPEPFLIDDSDLEVNEIRLDWTHIQGKGQVGDEGRLEFEKGFGLMTLELEVPYEINTSRTFDRAAHRTRSAREQGVGNVSIAARHPVYQYVSDDESIDSTFGVALEVGFPTNTVVSRTTEVVPIIFNDLRLGDHLTLQTVVGYSKSYGSGEEDDGLEVFEYGAVLGYSIPHETLPIPGVDRVIPIFELSGERTMNHGAGHNILIGNLAVRLNLKSIGPVQPRLGVGYLFPIDKGAKDELRWGVYTSLVFEF